MPSQLTSSILMVSPDTFGFNSQTSLSNSFQNNTAEGPETLRKQAMIEFNAMVKLLIAGGVDVFVLGIDSEEDLPDAVFPNNWFATFEDGTVMLFPMLAENRRMERQPDIIEGIMEPAGFKAAKLIDLSPFENSGKILEGTGSLVLDRKNNCVYAIESERTTAEMFDEYCSIMNIPPASRVFFHADDEKGNPIYHTNVMMSVGEGFAVVCDECISSWDERNEVINKLEECMIEVIRINYAQLNSFCGNILNLKNADGESLIVMSENARKAFTPTQISTLEKYGRIIAVDINTIEKTGGGSARCMIAEIFLPKEG